MTMFIAGNLLASERPWFGGFLELNTSNSADVEIGYKDISNNEYPQIYWYDKSSDTYSFGFSVGTNEPAPVKIYAKGWAPYSCYDYDECNAQLYGINNLQLWLGVVPDPGEPEAPEE